MGLPHNNTATSRAAAASMAAHAPSIRVELYALVVESGPTGLTADELQGLTGRPSHTVTPRVLELRRAGLVVKTTRTRPTIAGRAAAVYVARGADRDGE